MPLRLRLTLLYVVLLAVALAAFGLTVYLIASKGIYDGVDNGLSLQVEAVQSALDPLSAPVTQQDIDANRIELDSQATGGSLFEIRDVQGKVLYSSLVPPGRDLPLPHRSAPGQPHFMTRKLQGQRLRVLYQPFINDGQVIGSVEAAQPLKETDEALDEIRNVSIFGGLAVMLLINVPAYVLAGRALSPVRQVSQLAREIQRTADFSRRLPAQRGGGETAELIATFNAMIERVERTLVAQRAFLADSSHELRRPLTVIRTNIDLLNDPALPPDEREACVQEIRVEAEAMSHLLADLLFLSREEAQAIEHTSVDYTALCEQTMARLRVQDERHDLHIYAASGIRVRGDAGRLSQMLWNLLENAAQYTPSGGRIDMRLARVDGLARVEVADSGMGIPEGDLPNIFNRFFRGQDARSARPDGTGLGLAIVRYVAEAHGGIVSVESRPEQGSTFAVDIPAAPEQPRN